MNALLAVYNVVPKALILALLVFSGLGLAWEGVGLFNAKRAVLVAQAAQSMAKQQADEIRLQAEHIAANAAEAAQQESDRRWSAQLEVLQHAKQHEVAQAEAAASSAAHAAAGLRHQLADMSARATAGRSAGNDPSAAASCPSIATLADELGECGERYSAVAKQADANLVAGLICERSYDALISLPH